MALEEQTTSRPIRRWLIGTFSACAAVAVLLAPGIARAGSGESSGGASDQNQMVAGAVRTEQTIVRLWNEKKWDELAVQYTDDAIGVPPNHEPIHGGKAIAEYYRSLRDTAGELEGGTQWFRVQSSGDVVSLVGKYSIYSGRVRVTSHELYERQPDGSMKLAVDMFGYRDGPS
jgi:ketosteroid isomerase-like protein